MDPLGDVEKLGGPKGSLPLPARLLRFFEQVLQVGLSLHTIQLRPQTHFVPERLDARQRLLELVSHLIDLLL
eukprot:CAMPEP_0113275542 /NCGR_PEP_ID=MMETSP0008_2-20120614/25002_1 /TAXON_ID=97485 /ORGANISM="Prymnesium parvum" /LENGTH=71 /DNA_ID=CAMNT_0000125257 /DNA_START=50 /DNA_END=262 /DNA_ORIENTATION=+ /assembly_acc=CAM_ASM_000153